jgi:hypothetical protein
MGSTVVQACRREVLDVTAGGTQGEQPILFVAVSSHCLVERTYPLERTAPDREVRAPHHSGLGVVRTEVERGDRRLLAAA